MQPADYDRGGLLALLCYALFGYFLFGIPGAFAAVVVIGLIFLADPTT